MRLTLLMLFLWATPSVAGDLEPVAQEIAFPITAERLDAERIELTIGVLPGYALYRSSLVVQGQQTQVQSVQAPAGVPIEDPFLGSQRVFLTPVRVAVMASPPDGTETLSITTRGCQLDVLCYSSITRMVPVVAARLERGE